MVVGLLNSIQHRIAHQKVGGRHVDLGAQHTVPLLVVPRSHLGEVRQAFLHGAISVRARSARLIRFVAAPTSRADFLQRGMIHIGVPGLDQVNRPFVEGLKEVRGEVQSVLPVEAEPADILLNGLHVAILFRRRIGVVEAQVAHAAILFSQPEHRANRFGVPDVREPVGLGGEAGMHVGVATCSQVPINLVVQEMARFGVHPIRRGTWALE